jgi:hypothetical protein
MNLVVRLGLTGLACVAPSGPFGCLPDPRTYDACTDTYSYYSVPPQGCNNHLLSELAERRTITSYNDGYIPIESDISMDDTDVYWTGPNGEVLRTSKETSETIVVYEGTKATAVQLENDHSTLYIWRSTRKGTDIADIGELIAVDKHTVELRRITTVESWTPHHLRLFEGNAYVNAGGTTACLEKIPLDGAVPSCVLSGYVEDFEVTHDGIYFTTWGVSGRNLFKSSDDTSSPLILATEVSNVLAFEVDRGKARWIEFNNTTSSLRTVNTQGDDETVVSMPGSLSNALFQDDQIYAIGQLNDGTNVARLYSIDSSSIRPIMLAASMSFTSALAADEKHVYASVLDYGEENAEPTVRLYRVNR